MYEVVNRRMQRALAAAVSATGFAKDGQGAVTAGTGAQLVIAAYPDGALVDGLYVENAASETVTLTTNSNSNPRIDRLVMRLDMAAETIAPFQIVGTPAASPSAPPLVQTATVFDMPLCQYRFPGSASAQNPTNIIDERQASGEVSCRFTAAQPGGSIPANTLWGAGAVIITGQRGGTFTASTDRVTVPVAGLYHIVWSVGFDTTFSPRSYLQATVGSLTYRQPFGGPGESVGTLSTVASVTAGQQVLFQTSTNHTTGLAGASSHGFLVRIGDAF